MACCRIHQLVDPRKEEAVLGTGLVEVGEVDADSPFVALLLHQDRVGEPLRVVCLFNKIGSPQLVNFFEESLTSLCIHLPRFLLDGFDSLVNG